MREENEKTKTELEWTYKGYKCQAVFLKMGHRTGYVAIPKDHPLYNKIDFESDLINVHGGITYAQFSDGDYLIGFDFGHYGDGVDYNSTKKYFNTYPFLENSPEEKVYKLEDTISECKKVVDQLEKLKEENNGSLNNSD